MTPHQVTPRDDDSGDSSIDHDEVTQLLAEWQSGSEQALHRLMPLLYRELKRIAGLHMRSEREGHTLDPTDLLHQAYPRLLNLDLEWRDRSHFLNMASRTMRRVLVEHARARSRDKRGGGLARVTLADETPASSTVDVLTIDSALTQLATVDPRKSELLQAHYFGGMTYQELAEAFKLSEATIHRELRMAKAWLGRELRG